MTVNARNGVALAGVSAINGITKAAVAAINGQTLDAGGSYQLIDLFGGSSKNTTLWNATTIAPGWTSSTTVGGSDVETGGVVTITPTASADHIQGRSSVATNLALASNIMWVHKSVPSVVRHKTTFGYSHTANRGAQNIRWEMEYAFGSGTISALFNNFGGGTAFSMAYSPTDHAWWGIEDTGTDIVWYTAPDAAGVPGTPVERRRGSTSGIDYFSPNSGDVGFWVQNDNSEAVPAAVGFSAFWLTA